MSRSFEEIDYRPTAMGALSLRRRTSPADGTDIYEIKLGEAFLMSSRFTASETALAQLGLAEIAAPARSANGLDVLVGGLGLGYTAVAALADPQLHSLLIIERFGDVIDWHRLGLVPNGMPLRDDPRCRIAEGDFFALAASPEPGFDAECAGRRFDAVLLDIDHSPRDILHGAHAGFYQPAGLQLMARHLKPGGVFALWSNDPPDDAFLCHMAGAFAKSRAEVITFDDAQQQRTAASTIYLGQQAN